jgi:hypothetical protein
MKDGRCFVATEVRIHLQELPATWAELLEIEEHALKSLKASRSPRYASDDTKPKEQPLSFDGPSLN